MKRVTIISLIILAIGIGVVFALSPKAKNTPAPIEPIVTEVTENTTETTTTTVTTVKTTETKTTRVSTTTVTETTTTTTVTTQLETQVIQTTQQVVHSYEPPATKPHDSPVTKTVDEYFQMMPPKVQRAYFLDGWTYVKSNEDLSKKYFNNELKILGITMYSEHTVYIDYKYIANRAIFHEVGHRFAPEPFVKGPNSDEFKEVYEANWPNWYIDFGGHINNYKTITEGYAQCYEIYFMAPEYLDRATYEFIDNEIKMIENYIDELDHPQTTTIPEIETTETTTTETETTTTEIISTETETTTTEPVEEETTTTTESDFSDIDERKVRSIEEETEPIDDAVEEIEIYAAQTFSVKSFIFEGFNKIKNTMLNIHLIGNLFLRI